MIDAVRATDIIVEINTKAYPAPVGATPDQESVYEPRLFPSPDVIRRLVSAGLPLVVNSDAHYSSRITAGRAAAFVIIDE